MSRCWFCNRDGLYDSTLEDDIKLYTIFGIQIPLCSCCSDYHKIALDESVREWVGDNIFEIASTWGNFRVWMDDVNIHAYEDDMDYVDSKEFEEFCCEHCDVSMEGGFDVLDHVIKHADMFEGKTKDMMTNLLTRKLVKDD